MKIVLQYWKALLLTSMVILGGTTSVRADFFAPWTTAGSTGTVDESDTSNVIFSSSYATVRSTVSSTTVDIRYNVVAIDGLLSSGEGYFLKVRFRDNGTSARVRLFLKEHNIDTGTTVTRMSFDSDTYTSSSGFQTQSIPFCSPGWSFDFVNKIYYIEVQLIKGTTGGTPAIDAIQIGVTLC